MPTDSFPFSASSSSASADTPPTGGFIWPVRVYYEDTDAGGVVFHANYLKFFERARTEWLRATGISHHALVQEHGIVFVVRHVAIDYLAPAKLDDELSITVAVEKIGGASVYFLQQAWHAGSGETRLLATARVKVVCVDADAMRPTPFPEPVLQKIGFSSNPP